MPLSSAVTERLMTSDGDEQPHRKRKGFELARSCRPVQRVNQPPLKRHWKVGNSMGLIFGAAPLNISERLTQSSAIFAFDCETHELIPGHTSKWVTGRFGFKAQIDECAVRHLRLVQLGWAYGDRASLFPSAHKRLVKPSGFVISPGASNIHKIGDGAALVDGQQLEDVLHQMLDQACKCCDEGGRVASHHLGFDAIIICNELQRAGLGHLQEKWVNMVRGGICTMDPDIACWVRSAAGLRDDGGNEISWRIPIGLKDMLSILAPQHRNLFAGHHSADVDATMCWLICRELTNAAGGPNGSTEHKRRAQGTHAGNVPAIA